MTDLFIGVRVPRTASTSFQRVFKRKFRFSWAGAVGSTPSDAYDSFKLFSHLRKHAVTSISGHFPHGIHTFFPEYTPRYFTCVRDPVNRVASLWKFTYHFHELDLIDWIESHGDFAHNQLVRYFMGGPVIFPCTDLLMFRDASNPKLNDLTVDDFNLAQQNLSNYEIVGTVEGYDSFQRSLESAIGNDRFDIFWENSKEYDTTNPAKDYTPTIQESNRILELNSLDETLYDWVVGGRQ